MNDLKSKLVAIVSTAEAGVLKLVAEAAVVADYAAIDLARDTAERLRAINAAMVVGTRQKRDEPEQPSSRARKIRTKLSARKGEYPKYQVADGSLFKIGWSKKKGGEYVHRVPLSTARKISDGLGNLATGDEVVSTEVILHSDAFQAAGNPPSYQVYALLSFLKDRGAITAVGREGFRLPPDIASRARELLLHQGGG